MPNTQSTKKALRASLKKKQYNLVWKNRIKFARKDMTTSLDDNKISLDILNEKLVSLQKVLDKAAKKNIIHKNKANRLKSRYAKRITAQAETAAQKTTEPEPKPEAKSKKSKKTNN